MRYMFDAAGWGVVKSRYFLASICVIFTSSVFAELTLSPASVELKNPTDSAKVSVQHDGKPVLPGEITKVVAGVLKTGEAVPDTARGETHFSNYSYMFNFTANDDGSITLTPIEDTLQIGKYDFYVHTVHGTVTGIIDATLRDSIPPRPPSRNWPAAFTYDFTLPDYLYGQVVSIDLGPDKVRTYDWYVDGELHSSGLGLSSLRVWPEPGEHEISFVGRNAAGDIVSSWSGTARVLAKEVIKKTVRKGKKLMFKAPGGYSRVIWTYDGKVLADTQLDRSRSHSQMISFKRKGTHVVTCRVQGSENGNFQLITWSVKVK